MFRILLVDDEAQEREGIRFLIEKYRLPLSVVEAQNGQKALEYLKGHPVDILFTDVKMPYKDGLELAKETFQFNPDIRIKLKRLLRQLQPILIRHLHIGKQNIHRVPLQILQRLLPILRLHHRKRQPIFFNQEPDSLPLLCLIIHQQNPKHKILPFPISISYQLTASSPSLSMFERLPMLRQYKKDGKRG